MSRYFFLALWMVASCEAASPTPHPTTAPYIQAIGIVNQLQDGPDSSLVDSDAPLDNRTGQFLARNKRVFALLHDGRVNDEPQWVESTDKMDALLHQLNPVRSLANLGVLRARWLLKQDQPDQAVEQLLDVLALGRNVDRAKPVMVCSLVAIGTEEMAMTELAALLPTLPKATVSELPRRLKQLPPTVSFSDLIRGEQQFGGGMLTQQMPPPAGPEVFEAMSPFYTAIEKASEESPPLSADQFRQKVTQGVSTIDGKKHPISLTLAQNMIPSFTAFYSAFCLRQTHRAMLQSGISVVCDGDDSISKSADPYGDGPFELTKAQGGFELQGKLLDRKGNPVSMRFGK